MDRSFCCRRRKCRYTILVIACTSSQETAVLFVRSFVLLEVLAPRFSLRASSLMHHDSSGKIFDVDVIGLPALLGKGSDKGITMRVHEISCVCVGVLAFTFSSCRRRFATMVRCHS